MRIAVAVVLLGLACSTKPASKPRPRCEGIDEGAPCETGDTCHVTEQIACGVYRYECLGNSWTAFRTPCEPS